MINLKSVKKYNTYKYKKHINQGKLTYSQFHWHVTKISENDRALRIFDFQGFPFKTHITVIHTDLHEGSKWNSINYWYR